MRVVGLGGDEPVEGTADVVVAIDGPAGRARARSPGGSPSGPACATLDTGATYRAHPCAAAAGVPVDDPEAVADAAKAVDLGLEPRPARRPARCCWTGPSRGGARAPDVNATVSAVSAVPAVRELLVGLQRSLVGVGGIVVEGRDIGTVVWPDADVKVFLTASEHERPAAHRRRRGRRRDRRDPGPPRRHRQRPGRLPTRPAADALIIDSTTRPIDQVVDQLLQLIEAARANRPR